MKIGGIDGIMLLLRDISSTDVFIVILIDKSSYLYLKHLELLLYYLLPSQSQKVVNMDPQVCTDDTEVNEVGSHGFGAHRCTASGKNGQPQRRDLVNKGDGKIQASHRGGSMELS
ncbi:hypothetical protein ACTXT7_016638 [Hymenolepis weldensis]